MSIDRRRWLRASALALASCAGVCGAASVLARPLVDDSSAAPLAFYFAVGWYRADAPADTVVSLGIVYRDGQAWRAEVETFSSRANLPLAPLAQRHSMRAPGGPRQCRDAAFKTAGGVREMLRDVLVTFGGVASTDAAVMRTDATVTADAAAMQWRLGGHDYRWRRDGAGQWALEGVRPAAHASALTQVVGFAHEADAFAPVLDDLASLGDFDGEIHHKHANTKIDAPWAAKRSSIRFSRFEAAHDGSAVRNLTVPGTPAVEARYGKAMWVQHGLMLVPPASPHVRYVLHEYGHDFDVNGCFDEQGHNKLMLPVLRRGRVSSLVYVEYTPDARDGVPMVSVGRYVRHAAR